MKKTLAILAATCLLIGLTQAQTAIGTGTGKPSPIVSCQIGEQGANSRVWQKITRTVSAQGNITYQTNQAYVELTTGMNHLVNGQWVASKEEIDLLSNGTAAATNGQHQAYFPGDIYQGQIELVTPDGKTLQSRPLGLSYFDGNNSVLIAELKDSIGWLVGSNQVIYPNAFTGIAADLRYTYTKAGFEQDIILREQPPTPESFGLNPATARLEVLTEFFSPPQPTVQSTAMPAQAGLSLTDQSLGFGTMQMIPGRAFLLGQSAQDAADTGVRVDKQWLQLNGRQFLVEEVPVEAIADKLAELPLSAVQSSSSTTHTVAKTLVLPPQRLAKTSTRPVLLARASVPTQGLVLDYQTINCSFTNFTFRGDTTYYIDGTVVMGGTNTFEGGTVLKYDDWGRTELRLISWGGYNLWTFKTGPYRPAIFTSMDDDSVGETISNSLHILFNTQATYLCLDSDNYFPNPIQYARFSWAGTVIHQEYGTHCSPVLDCQFVNCAVAILDEETALFSVPVQELHNVLMSNCGLGVQNTWPFSVIVDGENMTVDQMDTLLSAGAGLSGNFTNCILSSVANLTNSTVYATISGDYNGFYNAPAFGTGQVTNTFYPFQVVGAGNYYLTNGCAFTNAGTTAIDPILLADLRQKTTYPPLLLTTSNQPPVSVNTNLSIQAWRDTDTPDLGYHYDPIDYLVDNYAITNATLTVTNGAAIASYNETGIQLRDGSAIVSIGSPLYPNWFIRYSSVQEKAISLGGTNPASGLTVSALHYGNVGPTGQYRFSKFACPAGGGNLFNDTGASAYSSLLVQDCELWSGPNDFSGNASTVTTLRNNLLERSAFTAMNTAPTSLSLSNNLIFGTTVFFYNQATPNTWQAFNNAFDSSTITTNQYIPLFGSLTNGYNAYLNCTNRLKPAGVFDIVTNATLAYQTGPLGTFYQPTNSPLIHKGSTTADQVGLYHYTVTTNEVVEGTNTVSIGYHYIAIDSYGNSLDSNSNGIPDYIEDGNGNGIVDNGESDWGLAILTQPQSQMVMQGSNATFSVTAGGITPLSYQWYFNGTNVLGGAANASLTLTNVQTTNAGNYYVIVTNNIGSLTSSVATLTVDLLSTNTLPYGASGYRYLVVATTNQFATFYTTNFDDSSFSNGQAAFGSTNSPGGSCNFYANCKTYWTNSTDLLLRRHFYVPPAATNVTLGLAIDNDAQIYINGILITNAAYVLTNGTPTTQAFTANGWFVHDNCPTYDSLLLEGVSNSVWRAGDNLLAVRGHSRSSLTFADVQITCWPIPGTTNSNQPLTVQIVSPTNQTLLARSNVIISAIATNSTPGVTISNVEFFANGTNRLGYAIGSTNGFYQCNWIPAVGGTNALTALATDSRGSNAWSSPVTNYVRNLPTVTITNPVNGQIFFLSSPMTSTNISINATAVADQTTIANVVFYQGTTALGTNTSSPYNLTWNNVAGGTYTLTAKATDNMGATGSSFPIQITVNPANQPPSVYAGPNQTTNLPTAQLTGFATDDGLPSNFLAVAWSRPSGPGTVTFGNSNQLVTTATFDVTGTNVLQLTASDGQLTSTSTVTICMVVSNSPPVVFAGSNQTIVCPVVVTNFVVFLTPVTTATNLVDEWGESIDYFIPSNSVMYTSSQQWHTGKNNFEIVSPTDGASIPFVSASITNLPAQAVFATVKDKLGGFSPGEIFMGNGNPGEIVRIRPDGTLVGTNGVNGNAWVVLTNEMRAAYGEGGAFYVDRTGIFGGDLIAVWNLGEGADVWRINSAGQATLLAQVFLPAQDYFSPVVTLPNNVEKYGPWAGKILVAASAFDCEGSGFYTIDTNGFTVLYAGLLASGLSIIPPNENLYALDVDNNCIWGAPASVLQGVAGDILVTESGLDESGGNTMYAIRWNGQAFEKTMVAVANEYGTYDYSHFWAQVAFAPTGIANVPASPYSVQLNGSVTDDGHMWANTTNTWVEVGGPGPVTFADATQTNTTASFTMPGAYVLRLIANDGEYTGHGDVTIQFIQNQPPTVNAGTNQVILTTSATLSGSVSDDGWPSNQLTVSWSQVNGPGTANFSWQTTNITSVTNFNAANSVSFTTNGTYILRLTASDGQASASADVMITVATPLLTLTPAYSGPFAQGSSQSVTATLRGTNGMVISNAVIQFVVTGVTPSTNLVTTDANGMARFTNNGASAGRDLIQASFTNGNQIVTSQPAVIDWGINMYCEYSEPDCWSTFTTCLSTATPTNELRYATYFLYTNSQAGTTLTLQFSGCYDWGNDPLLIFLKNSSNQVLASNQILATVSGCDREDGRLVYTLPAPGNYIIELTTAMTNDVSMTNYNDLIGYGISLSCNAPNPEMAVLLNGTNVPNGGTLIFGPTITNVAVTNVLVITNSGGSDLQLNNLYLQTNGDFQASLGASNVPPGGSTTLQVIFNASTNEISMGSLGLSVNTDAGQYVLTLLGSAFPPGTPPGIQLISPVNNTTYYELAVIPVTASVQPESDPVSYVSFQAYSYSFMFYWLINSSGVIPLGISSNAPYTVTWLTPYGGLSDYDFFITATAVDSVGRSTTTSPVLVHVLPLGAWETPPVAVDDQYTVPANSVNNILYPLSNDYDTNANITLTIVATTSPRFGSATVINNGQAINYTPSPGVRGFDSFSYEITDHRGGIAWASVAITIDGSSGPSVIVTNPPDYYTTNSGATVPIVACVTPSQNIVKVDFYLGNNRIGEVTNGVNGLYTNNWTAVYDSSGNILTASATDILGQVGASRPIHIYVTQSTNSGVVSASLDNIVDANGTTPLTTTNLVTVREGLFNVYGHASSSPPAGVAWQLGVYTLDGTLVRDLTPNPDSDGYNTTPIPSSTSLAACDLTTLINGVYILRLTAVGTDQMTDTDVRFRLESNLKLGQFSFSQQDIVIPVNGIPLTVTRTYNSLNANAPSSLLLNPSSSGSDFGPGWTYSLSDMDVSIDETRQNATDSDGQGFSERSGGNYDVTLTLPNGQRTTFYCQLVPTSLVTLQAVWKAAPGVTAKLEAQGNATLYNFSGLDKTYQPYWSSSDSQNVPVDNFDFPSFILTTQDGTRYVISRQDLGEHFMNNGGEGCYVHAYGNPYLSQILELNRDTITINSNSIVHTYANGATNQITFQRNAHGLIAAIFDPNAQASSPTPLASVKYDYDSRDNLIYVEKLVDRNAGTYVTNTFAYANANFPHYITGIINADGTQVAKNFYDDSGKLTAVQDANGNYIHYLHDVTNHIETIIDQLGYGSTNYYDLRGNITTTVNALGQTNRFAFDDNNYLLQSIDPLGHTNSYGYDANGCRIATTNALGQATHFNFDNYGQLLSKTDALTNTISFDYDSAGHRTNVTDALGHSTTFSHDIYGRPTTVTNALNQLRATAGSDSSGNLQFVSQVGGLQMNFGHDLNGNTTNTSFIWTNPGNPNDTRTLVTTTELDAANRVTRVTDPDNNSRMTIYDVAGRVAQNIDRMGNTNSYIYDALGNVIQTTYADGSVTRTVYDARSQVLYSDDRHLPGLAVNGTHNVYDSLGRVVRSERLANVQIDITSSGDIGQTVLTSAGAVLSASSTAYDAAGRMLAVTNAIGAVTSYEYDAAGRQTAVVDALTNRTDSVYDAGGQLRFTTNALKQVTEYQYDAKGRRIKTIFPDNSYTTNSYNEIGQLMFTKDQAGLETDYQYDSLGRMTNIIKPLVFNPEGGTNANPQWAYQYDSYGNILDIRDPKGRETKFTYDALGEPISRTLPLLQTNFNAYNALGQLDTSVDFKGQSNRFVYDSFGRVATNLLYAAGSSVPSQTNVFIYDANGRLYQTLRPEGISTFQYDLDGAVTNIASPEGWISYEYDPAMGWLTRAYTVNSDIRYGYDSLARLQTVSVVKRDGATLAVPEVTTNTYTPLGSLQNVYFPNGTWTVYQYDVMNHLTNEVHYNGASQVLAQYQYTVASDGTRLASAETRRESGGNYSTTQIAWTNDALHRLMREASSSTVTVLNFTNSYVYDLAGDRLWKTNFSSTGTQVTGYTYNANDQLLVESTGSTSFTNSYDANGSVTNRSSASEVNVYSYNLEGRLATAAINQQQTNKYYYNQSGIRTRVEMSGLVNGTNIFLNDPQNLTGFNQVLEELPSVGAMPTASYTIGSQVIAQERGGTVSFLMPDGHGSTRLLTGSTGAISDRYSYDAYGNGLDFTATTLNPPTTRLLYSGERFDSDLQQYYLRARYYNPAVGRFGAADQMDGTPNDPLSLHKYAYCQNNPVNRRDPSGNDLASLSFAMGIAETIDTINTFHAVWTLGKMITEEVIANESLDQIEGQPASPGVDTGTIIVHGVAGHSEGWSQGKDTSDPTPFQQNLQNARGKTPNPRVQNESLNHDFYEFDWGGFSIGSFGLYPIKSVHTMALAHLQMAEALVSMKGYANIDIISHSWGTTLAYDLMNSTDIEVHDWVTMGSPLKWTTEKPTENTGNWINYYSLKDPVMHYEIYPPFPTFWEMEYAWQTDVKGGQGLSGSLIIPKGFQRPYDMGKKSFDEHGAYWNDPQVLSDLRLQLQ